MEVIDHDFGFEADGVVVAFDKFAELFGGLFGVELGVVVGHSDEPVVAADGGVSLEDIEDEAFFDGLFHGVGVEGAVGDFALGVRGQGFAEHLERFGLGRGGEGEVAGVGEHLAGGHALFDRFVDGVFRIVARGIE